MKVVRAEEAVLGASFNAQSQEPDIPGASSRTASLRAYMEDLSASFNTQDQSPDDPQAPDDSHVQDRQCASRIFDDSLYKGNEVLTSCYNLEKLLSR